LKRKNVCEQADFSVLLPGPEGKTEISEKLHLEDEKWFWDKKWFK